MSIRSRRSSTDVLVLLLAAGLALTAPAARGQAQTEKPEAAAADLREKARAVLGNGYQSEIPGAKSGNAEGRAGQRPGRYGAPADGARTRTPPALDGQGSLLVQLALIVMAVAGLVVLAIWLVSSFLARPARKAALRETSGAAPSPPPDRPQPERGPALDEAERLAAQERWAEAVHALLLVAIRHLSARFSVPQASSRTSREMWRLLPLQAEAREAFGGLVRTVEVSLFGGAPVGSDDYRTSLERVRLLLRGAG